ncbi:MFS transporter [Nocardiopsis tropica]|uniref:MFS transporter n=1 Tax=Tsukamurella TaxID=2060 RepID=UPI001C7D66BF|nr:MFS transporter [Tsukamurella sp. TY48]GIZ97018.1 MFS transporter [Tsukamurella sp. TY48]
MARTLWPFIIGSVALGLDAYVIAGLLPAIASDLHTTQSLVGLGVTAFTGAYAISGPLLAGHAGRNSGRNLTIALAVFAVGNLLTLLAPTIAVFIAARIIAGAAAGVYSPLSSAVAAHLVAPERRGRALSLVLAGMATGSVFGVPLGLLVANRFDWRATIGIVTALGVAALIGVRFRGGDALPSIEAPGLTARLRSLTRTPTLLTVLVTLFTGIGSLGLYTYISPLLSTSSLSSHLTLSIWIWGIGGAVGVFAIGRIVDALKNTLAITAVITAVLALVLVVIGLEPAAVILAVGLFLWGALGWSSLAPQQHTLLAAAPNDGATAVAANSSANYLGSAVGSAIGALVIAGGTVGGSLALLAALPLALAFAIQLVRIRLARTAVAESATVS